MIKNIHKICGYFIFINLSLWKKILLQQKVSKKLEYIERKIIRLYNENIGGYDYD